VAVVNAGAKVPLFMARFDNAAFVEGYLVMVIITVLVVIPSCAVIMVVMVFEPTFKAIGDDAVPDVTAAPFTVMVAFTSFAVGITCTDVSLLNTAEVKFK
jgi:hypothetical protein